MTRAMLTKTLSAIALLLAFSGAARADWYSGTAEILEDAVQMEFWHDNRKQAKRCIRGVRKEMDRIDAMISADNSKSEIASINAQAAIKPVKVSSELYDLIDKALRFGRATQGAFDITFASVGFLFDYDRQLRPDEDQTREALQAVDYRLVQTDRVKRTVFLPREGMRIDIAGIAKGHAVDRAIKMLAACGSMNALVSAGGDTRAMSDRRGKPWVVEINTPGDNSDVLVRIPLNDRAISTSGDYERAFEQEGVRYHQIINPRTGDSPSDIRSVSVVGPDGIWCDALATGVFVLGVSAGMNAIEALDGYEAYIVDHHGGRHQTSGLTTEPDCSHSHTD